ncbi:MAG: hypothetical protein R3D67_00685 [Hyphomicrobiaceae bacterium]
MGLIEHVACHLARRCGRSNAVNFGRHFINKPGYDLDRLIGAIKAFRAQFGVSK